jgi:hypothetical protein
MKYYPTFEDVVSRTKHGTKLKITEMFSHEVVEEKEWTPQSRLIDWPGKLLSAEVTRFSIEGDVLVIEVEYDRDVDV